MQSKSKASKDVKAKDHALRAVLTKHTEKVLENEVQMNKSWKTGI